MGNNTTLPFPVTTLSSIPPDGETTPVASSNKKNKVPDEKIVDFWDRQRKLAEKFAEPTKKDAEEAERFFRGEPDVWINKETWDGPTTQENVFYRDVMVIAGQLIYSDPKALVNTARGKVQALLAKATEVLTNKTFKIKKYRIEIKRALIQAIFRNVSFVYHGWDPFTGLPTIQWCANEVWPDVNCHGDLTRAEWIIEEFFPTLDEILDDDEIDDDIKEDLQKNKNLLKYPDESTMADADAGTGAAGALAKVRAFKVFSTKGDAPFRRAGLKGDLGAGDLTGLMEDFANRKGPDGTTPDGKIGFSPHAPERATLGLDPTPEDGAIAEQVGAQEDADRVLLILVDGYRKVVKRGPWPLDYFARGELPYSMIRLTEQPGDLYGVSLFKILRPLFRIMNFILSFWFADARESVRRDNFYDEMALADGESTKLKSGVHNQWIRTRQGRTTNAVYTHEYAPRGDSPIFRLYETVKKAHDDTSGINDIARGDTGNVEKTAHEAALLNDRAEQAVGMLVDAVDDFVRQIAEKTVMALQRYVEKVSEYAPCDGCDGTGAIESKELSGQSIAGADQVPCPDCKGTGKSKNIIKKGADLFLPPDLAAGWDDELSLDEIRLELMVDVEPGSTRRSNQATKQQSLTQLFSLLGPIYEKYQLFRPFFEFITRIVGTSELPDHDQLAPTEQEMQQAIQQFIANQKAMQQAEMQKNAPPPAQAPEPPDPVEQAKAAQEMKLKAGEFKLKIADQQHKHALDQQKAGLEKQRAQFEGQQAVQQAGAQDDSANGQIDMLEKQLQAMQQQQAKMNAEILNGLAEVANTMKELRGGAAPKAA